MPANPEVLEHIDAPDPLARTDTPRARGVMGGGVPEGDGDGDEEQLTLRGLVLQVRLRLCLRSPPHALSCYFCYSVTLDQTACQRFCRSGGMALLFAISAARCRFSLPF